jgi:hypothetical protein
MAQEDAFCGDRLRLTAFLRVADSMPPRPARFRRRLMSKLGDHADHAMHTVYDTSIANVPSLQFLPTVHTLLAKHSEESGLENHRKATSMLGPSMSAEEMGSLGTSLPTPTSSLNLCNVDMQHSTSERPSNLLPVRTVVGKKTAVSTPEAKQLEHTSVEPLNARQKKQLPVIGLALVRTSTEEGLPSPGVRSSPLGIIHIV